MDMIMEHEMDDGAMKDQGNFCHATMRNACLVGTNTEVLLSSR